MIQSILTCFTTSFIISILRSFYYYLLQETQWDLTDFWKIALYEHILLRTLKKMDATGNIDAGTIEL